jgi:hypothetical protein
MRICTVLPSVETALVFDVVGKSRRYLGDVNVCGNTATVLRNGESYENVLWCAEWNCDVQLATVFEHLHWYWISHLLFDIIVCCWLRVRRYSAKISSEYLWRRLVSSQMTRDIFNAWLVRIWYVEVKWSEQLLGWRNLGVVITWYNSSERLIHELSKGYKHISARWFQTLYPHQQQATSLARAQSKLLYISVTAGEVERHLTACKGGSGISRVGIR